MADLLEVRMGIECQAAALAAQRADDYDIQALNKSLGEMQQEFESGRSGTDADVSFHMAIAFAAKNPVHSFVMNSFSNYLFHGNRELLKQIYERGENTGKVLNQHRTIVRHIRNRDPDKAYGAMKEHINFFADFVKRCP